MSTDYYYTTVDGEPAQVIVARYNGRRVRLAVWVLDEDPLATLDGCPVNYSETPEEHVIAGVNGKMAIGFTREHAYERLKNQ